MRVTKKKGDKIVLEGTAQFTDYRKNFKVEKRFIHKSRPHAHAFFELELCLSGEGYVSINGIDYPLQRGVLYFNGPMDFHAITDATGGGIELWHIAFLDTAEHQHILNCAVSSIGALREEELAKICALAEIAADEQKNAPVESTQVADFCFEAILALAARALTKVEAPAENAIEKAIGFIQAHFNENITLQQVADHVGFTSPHFSSMFHQKVGISYKKYLTTVRVSHAVKLFRTTSMSATDIALEVGFNSYSGFARAFTQIVGVSPKQCSSTNLTGILPQ